MKKIGMFVCLLMGCFLFAGCTPKAELEDREFVMAVGVDKKEDDIQVSYGFPDLKGLTGQEKGDNEGNGSQQAKSFYGAEIKYQNTSDKKLDYAHLKVVILGEQLLDSPAKLQRLLEYFENSEIISDNTLLFAAENPEEIMKEAGQLGGSIGIYLKNLYESNEYLTEQKSVTIGDFIKYWHNDTDNVLLPAFHLAKKKITIGDYIVMDGLACLGKMSPKKAEMIFLARGIQGNYYEKYEENDLKVSLLNSEYNFSKENEKPVLHMKLNCKMQILGRQPADDAKLYLVQKEVKGNIESRIRSILTSWQKEHGVDLANSFVMLGSRDRKQWKAYEKKKESYEKEIRYKISVNWEAV